MKKYTSWGVANLHVRFDSHALPVYLGDRIDEVREGNPNEEMLINPMVLWGRPGTTWRMEHEAGVEPACFGFKAQRGCRQPTARVLDQAAGIGPAWATFRA